MEALVPIVAALVPLGKQILELIGLIPRVAAEQLTVAQVEEEIARITARRASDDAEEWAAAGEKL